MEILHAGRRLSQAHRSAPRRAGGYLGDPDFLSIALSFCSLQARKSH